MKVSPINYNTDSSKLFIQLGKKHNLIKLKCDFNTETADVILDKLNWETHGFEAVLSVLDFGFTVNDIYLDIANKTAIKTDKYTLPCLYDKQAEELDNLRKNTAFFYEHFPNSKSLKHNMTNGNILGFFNAISREAKKIEDVNIKIHEGKSLVLENITIPTYKYPEDMIDYIKITYILRGWTHVDLDFTNKIFKFKR